MTSAPTARWVRTATAAVSLLAATLCVALPSTAARAADRPVLGIAAGGTIQYEPAAQRDAYLQAAHDLGATWLRFDFAWSSVQQKAGGSYDWARYDAMVTAAQAHGLQVLGMIGYPPAWARDPACAGSPVCRPRDPGEYAAFAGKVAQRYASRGVHQWEIWNEPNIVSFFQPTPDPAYYTRMLTGAYTAIHAADADAKVVTGGMSPAASEGGNVSPPAFLSQMYSAGAHGYFDVVGHHPYCYEGAANCPGTTAKWSAWAQMALTSTSLRSLMVAHSDGAKQVWATEFGAPTSGGSTAVTEQQQSAMLVDGLRRFSGYSWGGPLFVYSLRDRGTNHADREDWFGVIRADGSRKPAFAVLANLLAGAQVSGSGTAQPQASTAAKAKAAAAAKAKAAAKAAAAAKAKAAAAKASAAAAVPVAPAPALDTLSSAEAVAGTSVTLTGTNLGAAPVDVYFGDRRSDRVLVTGAGSVSARVPAAKAGSRVDVTVFVGQRSARLSDAFTYRHPSWWKRLWHKVF